MFGFKKKKQFDWAYATDPCNSVFDDVSNHGNQMVICATPVGRIGITYIPSQLCDWLKKKHTPFSEDNTKIWLKLRCKCL